MRQKAVMGTCVLFLTAEVAAGLESGSPRQSKSDSSRPVTDSSSESDSSGQTTEASRESREGNDVGTGSKVQGQDPDPKASPKGKKKNKRRKKNKKKENETHRSDEESAAKRTTDRPAKKPFVKISFLMNLMAETLAISSTKEYKSAPDGTGGSGAGGGTDTNDKKKSKTPSLSYKPDSTENIGAMVLVGGFEFSLLSSVGSSKPDGAPDPVGSRHTAYTLRKYGGSYGIEVFQSMTSGYYLDSADVYEPKDSDPGRYRKDIETVSDGVNLIYMFSPAEADFQIAVDPSDVSSHIVRVENKIPWSGYVQVSANRLSIQGDEVLVPEDAQRYFPASSVWDRAEFQSLSTSIGALLTASPGRVEGEDDGHAVGNVVLGGSIGPSFVMSKTNAEKDAAILDGGFNVTFYFGYSMLVNDWFQFGMRVLADAPSYFAKEYTVLDFRGQGLISVAAQM